MSEVKIPEGYKQTEVGVIPEDWEVTTIGDFSPLQRGFDLPTTQVEAGEYPVVYSNGILRTHKAFQVNGAGIVTGRSGTIGKVHYVERDFWPHNTTLWVTSFGNSNVKFVYYLFNSIGFERFKSGSGVPTLNRNDAHSFKIVVPSEVKEQTAIATALSDVDDLIGSLEKLIAKKEAIKTATMQQLLTGKTRLPEFATHDDGNAKGFKQTELGRIPEDLELLSVREVCDLLTGFPFPSSKYQESGIRLLRGSNVKRGNTDWSDNITKFWAEPTNGIEQYFLQEADIVVSMDGSLVGRSFAQLSSSDLPALLLQRVARLRTSLVSQNYLKEWVCSPIFSDYCDSVKTVTAIPHISPADILNFRLFIPNSKAEQTAITTILSDMDSEIQALQKRLKKTRDIKQGMMQQLLTGKVRLLSSDSSSTHPSADNGDCLA